jgi:hypothetical protein
VFSKGSKPAAEPSVEHLRGLFLLGAFRQTDTSDPRRAGPTSFEFEEIKFKVEEPIVKAALLELGAIFPHALPFDELNKRALARLGNHVDNPPLADGLLRLVLAGSLFVRGSPVRGPSESSRASPRRRAFNSTPSSARQQRSIPQCGCRLYSSVKPCALATDNALVTKS